MSDVISDMEKTMRKMLDEQPAESFGDKALRRMAEMINGCDKSKANEAKLRDALIALLANPREMTNHAKRVLEETKP